MRLTAKQSKGRKKVTSAASQVSMLAAASRRYRRYCCHPNHHDAGRGISAPAILSSGSQTGWRNPPRGACNHWTQVHRRSAKDYHWERQRLHSIQHVQPLWRQPVLRVIPAATGKGSCVKVDEATAGNGVADRYIEDGLWSTSARHNKGSGLWCVKAGRHPIFFTGPESLTIRTDEKPTQTGQVHGDGPGQRYNYA